MWIMFDILLSVLSNGIISVRVLNILSKSLKQILKKDYPKRLMTDVKNWQSWFVVSVDLEMNWCKYFPQKESWEFTSPSSEYKQFVFKIVEPFILVHTRHFFFCFDSHNMFKFCLMYLFYIVTFCGGKNLILYFASSIIL